MTTIFAPTALLPDGWADNVLIELDKDGWIVGVDSFKTSTPTKDAEVVKGPLIPGMSNVHSHAFQRAMAGLAERGAGRKRNFWGWRETMYRFLSRISVEDMEAIAAQVYVEMLKAGYTTVGEFHYVHHQPDGTPYADRALMSRHILQAAMDTGIAITHMPTLYAYSSFKEAPPNEGQRRFLNTVPHVMEIVEALHRDYAGIPQVTVGFAHHSLRAVSAEMLREGTRAVRALMPDCPIHIHAAEVMGEVEGCLEWSGKRPVEWLLENGDIDDKWTFIHCTHVTPEETKALATSGVVVGLCPTTEANLGDGVFPMVDFAQADGVFAIGSDSHISISVIEELRWMEYVQRLTRQERTLLRNSENPSVGASLYERAAAGGARSMGRKAGRIEIGHRADFLVLNAELPFMEGKLRDHILDAAIFAANENPIRDVMAGGRWVVKDGCHRREDEFLERYRQAVKNLA